jgi:UDP-N-acetylmuramate dehydrogenase
MITMTVPITQTPVPIHLLRAAFGNALQENVVMANYTTAHVGGRADALLVVHSAQELEKASQQLWEMGVPFYVLGSGSNVLISDEGTQGVVIINRAHTVKIDTRSEIPSVWAESGAIFSSVARQAALRGLSGLEWAATIPGTVGGAVYGNAGAFGGEMAGNLLLAEILHPSGRQNWTQEDMQYAYRTSALKKLPDQSVILAARMRLHPSSPAEVQAKMDEYTTRRRATQPPGASLGSMFKNPSGDYAGRLIEAAGLKGKKIGNAEISSQHANFFITHSNATARDIYQLIQLVEKTVYQKFGVALELEIECIGNFGKQA